MKKTVQKIIQFVGNLTNKTTHPHTIKLFRKTLHLYLLGTIILYYPIKDHIWGPLSYSLTKTDASYPLFDRILDILNIYGWGDYYNFFLWAQVTFLFLGIIEIYPRLINILVCYFNFVLNNKAWSSITGGNHLVEAMLIYLIFMDYNSSEVRAEDRPPQKIFKMFNHSFTNLAFFTAQLQLVLVYLVSAIAKLQGHFWTNGTALYYVLVHDEFSTPFSTKYILSHDFLIIAGTYFTLAFQLCFPFLIWNRKLRPFLFILGTFMHLQISLVLGLLDFGVAVMVCYFLFYEDWRAQRFMAAMTIKKFPPFLRPLFHRMEGQKIRSLHEWVRRRKAGPL